MLTASYLRAFDASSAIRLAISETLHGQESSRRQGVKNGSCVPDFDRFAFVLDNGLHMGGDSMYIEREIEQTIDSMLG